MESNEQCVCGHPAVSGRESDGLPPAHAEIMSRIKEIQQRRVELAEELGSLTAEENTLRARLARLHG